MDEMGALQCSHRRVRRQDGHELPVEQRPIREHQRSAGGGYLRAKEKQRVDGRSREHDGERQSLRCPALRQFGREISADNDESQQPEQDHRRRQVRRDPLAGVAGVDRDLTQIGLENRQDECRERRDHERAGGPLASPGDDDERQDEQAHDHRDGAMNPFDPGRTVRERRNERAMAGGPVRAAHAGAGAAHDGADNHQQEGGYGSGQRQALKSAHRALRIVEPSGSRGG